MSSHISLHLLCGWLKLEASSRVNVNVSHEDVLTAHETHLDVDTRKIQTQQECSTEVLWIDSLSTHFVPHHIYHK